MSLLRALPALLALAAAAAAAPATYDQRQEGEFNVRADVQNIVLLAVIPGKMAAVDPLAFLGGLKAAERRADGLEVLEAFVEPGTPYRVEISGKAGAEAEEGAPVEMKLLGAQEQCGPGRSRDREGVCRDDAAPSPPPAQPQSAPEVPEAPTAQAQLQPAPEEAVAAAAQP